jgi:hypothetical protein
MKIGQTWIASLGGETAQVLLKLPGVAHAHHQKAGVIVQTKEQDASARLVGEG